MSTQTSAVSDVAVGIILPSMVVRITTVYTKLLVARHSPQNHCYARDGDVLTVVPRHSVPLRDSVQHRFQSTSKPGLRSKYGWVADAGPFDLESFSAKYLSGRALTQSEEDHLRIVFESISKLPADTPVTADYSMRGVEEKRMDFTVHRVLFFTSED